MDKYFFSLGRYPEISVAEISTVLSRNNMRPEISVKSPEIVIFQTDRNPGDLFPQLGGSTKFGRVLGEASLDDPENVFESYLDSDFLKENVLDNPGLKQHFGISVYNAGAEYAIFGKVAGNIKYFNKTVKENLKKEGISSGFLRVKERILAPVAVFKNELLTHGFELNLIVTKESILIGKTNSVQDFESFAKRDIQRPRKDKKSGILPVKLARIMVNLLPQKPEVLLDPFCGSGTVIMEASLLGIKNLIATDISDKAVNDTKVNLEWLFGEYGLSRSGIRLRMKTADARQLDKIAGTNITDAIVTEPYLGPPLFRQPAQLPSQKALIQLTPLYSESLRVFHELLKTPGYVVMVFPFMKSVGKDVFIDKKIISPKEFRLIGSHLYSSPGQFTGREIVVLQKI